MIPKTLSTNHLARPQKSTSTPAWITELREAIRDPQELCQALNLSPDVLTGGTEGLQLAHTLFSTLVPQSYFQRMQPGNPLDPLLLQVLPTAAEAEKITGFVTDPLKEAAYNPLPGLIHKYKSRVLLTLSGACAINCRYCFRRHFPYAENSLSSKALDKILVYLQRHPEVNEVILSGGDPLATSDQRLGQLIQQLEQLPQLKRLRVHTRLPVVIPSRITSELVQHLQATRLQTICVLHINHPQEINEQLADALYPLTAAGVLLLNQSVLLKNINNQASTLAELSEKLFACGVLPYYLHTLDAVEGAAHFALEPQSIQCIYSELLALLPGFLVPRLVTEEADQPSKTPLGCSF